MSIVTIRYKLGMTLPCKTRFTNNKLGTMCIPMENRDTCGVAHGSLKLTEILILNNIT